MLPQADAATGACRLALEASLPLSLTSDGQALLVQVMLNGTPRTMQLDTGATVATLRQGLWTGAETQRSSILATSVRTGWLVTTFLQTGLQLGAITAEFSVVLTPDGLKAGGRPIDGILGMDVLGPWDIDLDLPGHTLRLFKASGDCRSAVVALAGPTYPVAMIDHENSIRFVQGIPFHHDYRPYFDVTVRGRTLTAQLETRTATALMFKSASVHSGVADDTASITRHGKIFDFRDSYPFHRLDTIGIGPLTFRNVEVGVDSTEDGPAEMMMGIDFVKRVHVWISHSSQTIVLQYPPQASPALTTSP